MLKLAMPRNVSSKTEDADALVGQRLLQAGLKSCINDLNHRLR